MSDIRNLKLLVSLSRHKHFSRAAEDCGISQPAFSARIRSIEEEFGLPLVRRGNKFMGFTREGEVMLRWARKILADVEGMRQEIDALNSNLKGKLVVGTIPTALPFAADVSAQLRRDHPNLSIEIQSLSSTQIDIRLNDYSLDAGLTYVEDADPDTIEFLYSETYALIAPESLAPRKSGTATWAEAAQLPLCLLTTNMRNRQFVDEVFEQIDVSPTIVMQTSGFTAALALVASGSAATIAPLRIVDTYFADQSSVRLELVEPSVSHAVGLSIKDQTPVLPAVQALRVAVRNSL